MQRLQITLDVTVLSGMAEMAFERLADAIANPPKSRFVVRKRIYVKDKGLM